MADKLFDAFANGQDEMRFKEFVCTVLTMSMSTTDTLINFLFDMYDADKNKTMDEDELKVSYRLGVVKPKSETRNAIYVH